VYDGDGSRVRQTIVTDQGEETTYFVGTYYEVTGEAVTKYYYAGGQRIAIRADGNLAFLLGDHLGSTSLTTDAAGNVLAEQRYTAWGEVRFDSGDLLTSYTYTGQYSYASDFGLMFYNARWYDATLGRFVQTDSIVAGIHGLDRYAYVNNSPIRYVDPTGHRFAACDPGGCGGVIKTAPVCSSIYCSPVFVPSSGGNGNSGGGSSGGGALTCGFSCTEAQIREATLEQRLGWFDWMRHDMSYRIGSNAGGWFLNISTVIKGFIITGQDSNEWVLNVDATILVAIQNGYAKSLNAYYGPPLTPETGGLWEAFFISLREHRSDQQLIAEWGAAELATTNYGKDK
jgi:RHS repeat-associated protein